MAKQLKGVIACAMVEKFDVFQWTDPANGQVKPIRSLKVLLEAGDGTITRESISIPSSMPDPRLDEGKVYALPCTVTANKRRLAISYQLRADVPPFPAPEMDGRQLKGFIACATVEKFDVFQWTDPANGQVKPIRSLKVLLEAGDGTVSRESISIPSSMPDPRLDEGKVYALPCTVTLNKKRQTISFQLRADMPAFSAPEMEAA